jgi:polar amino acid transport system substrate-binding protein
MKKMLFVAFAALSLFVSCSSGPKKIVIASDTTFPPMEFVDEKQQIVGFDIDLMNAVAKSAGIEVTIKTVAWDGIFAGLANGDYDAVVSSVTITEERQKNYDFTKPYINAGQITVVNKDATAKTLLELKGQPVGAQLGTTGASTVEKVFGNKDNLKAYDEIGLAFEDLFNKRLAAVVIDTPVAAQYVLRNEKYKSAFMMIGDPLSDENYGIVVKKGNQALLDLLNTGLDKVKADGTYDKIKAQWLQ